MWWKGVDITHTHFKFISSGHKAQLCVVIRWIHPVLVHTIAGAARNWMISLPQTKVTTFAFASVFILLLCSQQFCTFIEHNIQPKSGTIAVYEPEITNYSRYQTSYILFFTNWEHLHRSIDRSTTRTCNFSLSYSTIFKFWLWIETVKKKLTVAGIPRFYTK